MIVLSQAMKQNNFGGTDMTRKKLLRLIETGLKQLEEKKSIGLNKKESKDFDKFTALRALISSMNPQKDNTIVASIKRISSSGMNRDIGFAMITSKGNLFNMTYCMSKLAECKLNDNHTIRVGGCGMDMVFHSLYNFNGNVIRLLKDYNLIKEKELKEDNNYNFIVSTNYSTI